jgi:hypothetical protein
MSLIIKPLSRIISYYPYICTLTSFGQFIWPLSGSHKKHINEFSLKKGPFSKTLLFPSSLSFSLSLFLPSLSLSLYIYIYICVCVCVCACVLKKVDIKLIKNEPYTRSQFSVCVPFHRRKKLSLTIESTKNEPTKMDVKPRIGYTLLLWMNKQFKMQSSWCVAQKCADGCSQIFWLQFLNTLNSCNTATLYGNLPRIWATLSRCVI